MLGFTYGKEKPQLDPVKIEINESIVQIASADNSTLALTKSGHIYIWGAYRFVIMSVVERRNVLMRLSHVTGCFGELANGQTQKSPL